MNGLREKILKLSGPERIAIAIALYESILDTTANDHEKRLAIEYKIRTLRQQTVAKGDKQ